MKKSTVYKTWIRINRIIIFSVISLLLIGVAVLPFNPVIRIISGLIALPFLYTTFMIIYSYYQFSDFGGGFQSKIHNLIIDRIIIRKEIKVLDIGAGNGALIIKIAKLLKSGSLVGIDYWGEDWEYSKSRCELNAECEGVKEKTDFIKGSASKLPFENNVFDTIVSCLTFHEVKDEKNKIKVVKEGLRVLKKDGQFIFLDLFLDEKTFGSNAEFLNKISSMGVSNLKIEKLKDCIEIPSILLHKKVLGNALIISGIK